ncbi:MAG: HAMP domain-containing histidine kinase [Flavobacteriales bacterium]|nr:HAMP domain-containing histidine kinase [Flavobacteriales bacterium]
MRLSIKHSILLTFSLLFAIIFLILGYSMYSYISNNTEQNFFEQLEKRTDISEQFFLELGGLDEEEQNLLKNKFIQALPDEEEYLFEYQSDHQLKDSLKDNISVTPEVFSKILSQPQSSFFTEKKQGYAKKYNHAGKQFLVVVLAFDEEGHTIMNFLKRALLITFVLGVMIVTLLTNILSGRIVSPIQNLAWQLEHLNEANLAEIEINKDTFSEIKTLKNTFNLLIAKLNKAFSIQKQFVANASHELRNPLASMLGTSEVLLTKERTPEELKNGLSSIMQETARLSNLVNGLLKLTKLGNNISQVCLKPQRVDEIMDRIIESHEQKERLKYLITDLPKNPDDLVIQVDPELFEAAIINVIDNALKFSEDHVEIRLDAGSGKKKISIKDTGQGMPPEELEKIFDTFYRSAKSREVKGFGIGLALTKLILDLHGADIEVDSKLGEGSMFKISISS